MQAAHVMERRVLVAADASYDRGVGKAGLFVVIRPGTPEESRVGRVLDTPRQLHRQWGDQSAYVAQLSWQCWLLSWWHVQEASEAAEICVSLTAQQQ